MNAFKKIVFFLLFPEVFNAKPKVGGDEKTKTKKKQTQKQKQKTYLERKKRGGGLKSFKFGNS